MAIKKDGSGKRWVEMELTVPGTPEEVWNAIATGNGNTGWFTKTTIDERVGGALRFDFGPSGASAGEVTTWEPPSKLGYVERDWSPAAPQSHTGVVEKITQQARERILLMRVAMPGPGIAMFAASEMTPGKVTVSATHYFYGDDAAARAADAEPRWRTWLAERFPTPASTEA